LKDDVPLWWRYLIYTVQGFIGGMILAATLFYGYVRISNDIYTREQIAKEKEKQEQLTRDSHVRPPKH
jgi:hypothetical protein